jgi:hypothetical protein
MSFEGKELGRLLGALKAKFDNDNSYYEHVLEQGRQNMLDEIAALKED